MQYFKFYTFRIFFACAICFVQANEIALSFHRVIAVRLSIQNQLNEDQNKTSPDAPTTSPEASISPKKSASSIAKSVQRKVLRYESLSSDEEEKPTTNDQKPPPKSDAMVRVSSTSSAVIVDMTPKKMRLNGKKSPLSSEANNNYKNTSKLKKLNENVQGYSQVLATAPKKPSAGSVQRDDVTLVSMKRISSSGKVVDSY